ncbi:hypothetical protein EV690_0697 [Celerinatantimonas diazotrophica]|uniref:Uncharacterized protein n=2 Tax=Celerinatantimonas diazotrophica TaxID=412034 RepID=A0A4R1K3T8_9GAMM|nr:hypothetical protein EV690_0697 [Celerinatantimonas diazotrophica]CAG9297196.1 hypothetical protein CEDIAZO_02366 [Celerinatantimonas diazotrophica]
MWMKWKKMTVPAKKSLYKLLEERVIAGEKKADIYAPFARMPEAKRVARILAQIPTPQRRAQFKRLNQILMVVIAVLALIKALSVFLYVHQNAMPYGGLYILMAPILNIVLIWVIGKYRGIGYLLIVLLGITALSNVIQSFALQFSGLGSFINVINLFGVIASMALSLILLKNLLPQTNFLLAPKKDAQGNPTFEE